MAQAFLGAGRQEGNNIGLGRLSLFVLRGQLAEDDKSSH